MKNKKNIWVEIVRTLNEKKLTIATMESCTGGGIANEITNISGASAVLHESYVTYCNEAKIKLGVPAKVIEEHTVYSEETAIAMAKAVVKLAKSDVGVGVTGQLGRIDPNNPVEKLNCVWFAVAKGENILIKKINVPNASRNLQKEFVLDEVATALLEII